MPLPKGCSRKTFSKIVAKMVREGRPARQAVAIAASTQRKNCKCRTSIGPRGGRVLKCKPRRKR